VVQALWCDTHLKNTLFSVYQQCSHRG
jgi:hypothetical protein